MSARLASALYLALGFAMVSYIAVFVEPGMGFKTAGDFLDPGKVAAGMDSLAWRIEGPLYLAFPITFWVLARNSDDRYLVWSGVASGILFLLVAAFDRTMAQLPGLLSDDRAISAIGAVLPVRLAVLKAAVAFIGVFAWRTTREGPGAGALAASWRAVGYLVLAVCVAFLYVFIPVPLVIAAWATALAAREARKLKAA